MQGEEGSDGRAAPEGSRHTREDHEEKQRVRDVKQEVDLMVRARLRTEQLHVQHMREPGERVPVTDAGRSERPTCVIEAESREHTIVLDDVGPIVESDESVLRNGCVDHDRYHDQKRQGEMAS